MAKQVSASINNRNKAFGPIRTGQVVSLDQRGLWLQIEASSCATCRVSCNSKNLKQIHLADTLLTGPLTVPSAVGSQIELSISIKSQLWLLLNSLILPLIGFVFGAVLADYLFQNELLNLMYAVFGMAIGVLTCRHFPQGMIDVKRKV